jgi:hypothetical protein
MLIVAMKFIMIIVCVLGPLSYSCILRPLKIQNIEKHCSNLGILTEREKAHYN